MKYKDLPLARTYLEMDKDGVPSTRRLRVCMLSLLWEVARADKDVSKDEFLKIIRLACFEFHLMDEEAKELLDLAAVVDDEKAHFDQFIGEINCHLDREQREYLYQLLVEVAKVDKHLSFDEQTYLDKLKEKLNLIAS